jgi:type II secretory pathway predicted ATPase ExeA
MSESFFGLRKRPFAALPDVDCFIPLEGICRASEGLLQAAAEGRGIGVLTAPAGLGKTLVCQRLARELSASFRVVLLPTGNFLTRRSLLQAILFELGHSYVRMGDQELRLALSATLQSIRPRQRGLVLIVDEAHLLAARMLEELRALLSFGEAGEPLVRLIVSGQLALEETLSRPDCDAFNQRIACQVMLPTFTREESSSYLTRRLAWAGANVSDVFTRESLIAICEAADGIPRCLHQLADHCLSLAANRGEKPIGLRAVREALDHLKQLPLTFAEPTVGRGMSSPIEEARAQAAMNTQASIDEDDSVADASDWLPRQVRESLEEPLYETYPLQANSASQLISQSDLVSSWASEDQIEADVELGSTVELGNSLQREIEYAPESDDENAEPELISSPIAGASEMAEEVVLPQLESPPVEVGPSIIAEEVVIDRYAALDSALNRLTRTMLNVRANARRKAVEAVAAPVVSASIPLPGEAIDSVNTRFDVVLPEDEVLEELEESGHSTASVARSSVEKEFAIDNRVAMGVQEPAVAATSVAVASSASAMTSARETATRTTSDDRRPYQLLFSELRRRRRRV